MSWFKETNWAPTRTRTSQKRKDGIAYGTRVCAVSHDVVSLAQPGRTGGMFLGH